jgi:DNA-binding transcriptional LysR family regulator
MRQLEYLIALDRERHFGRAAAACHVGQPTLSQAVRRLEAELGVPLVRRSRTFEGLTPEGERMLVWAQRAVNEMEGLTQEVSRLRGGLEGALHIGAIPTSLPLSPRLTRRFREHHPLVRIRLQSLTSRQILHGLVHGELDAGMTYLDNEPLPDVDTLPLWRERLWLVVDAASPFYDADEVTWRDAATLPLGLLTPDMQHRRIVDAAFASAGARPKPSLETNSVSTLVTHARTGLPSVTAQTWLIANPLPDGLRAVPLVEPVVVHTIGMITAADRRRTPIVAELMTMFSPFELDDISPDPQRMRRPMSSTP